MSSPETLTLEQSPDQLDPALYPEYSQYASQEGLDAYNPYPEQGYGIPTQRTPEDTFIGAAEDAATRRLIELEAEAIWAASADSAPEAVQAAQHDRRVIEAKEAVDEASAGSTTAVVQSAIEQAIKISDVETDNKTAIARTAAEGRSPVDVAKQAAPVVEEDAAEGYAELEDKPNVQADKVVTGLSKHAANTLGRMGVRVGRRKLKGQIAGAGGGELTDVAKAHHIEQQTIGKDFLLSFADNKFRGNRAKRQEAIKVLRETGELRKAAEALSRLKGGGTVSDGTARRIGKKLQDAFSKH